jgi:CRISPR-associated endonuclease/helicase Cas3
MVKFSQGLLAFWAKSDQGGTSHSLAGHLLDAAAVAELIWDEFLTPAARRALDECTDSRGRDVLRLVSGWHDLGKATPAFQVKVPALFAAVEEAGFVAPRLAGGQALKHGHSGSRIARRALAASRATGWEWLLPLVAGHHGSFLSPDRYAYDGSWQDGPAEGGRSWIDAQQSLARAVVYELGIELDELSLSLPRRAVQLAAAGWVSMADWIASSDAFPGRGRSAVSILESRRRASTAWRALGLHYQASWSGPRSFRSIFGFSPTPLQERVMERAAALSGGGLLVVEAPMGAGKTEAALAGLEVMARAGGHEGFVFAMPTQGTTDAMLDRVLSWSRVVSEGMPVALVHGKAMLHERWRDRASEVSFADICDPEMPDEYGLSSSDEPASAAGVPSQWLVGRHRGLLSPGVVATVDQPLLSATHVKYVALRFAGLVGKVLVIDEVHSYDIFMSQYLHQLLWWCGDGRIPVILMSATLPPAQRQELVAAYAQGGDPERGHIAQESCAYPSLTTWTPGHGVRVEHVPHSRVTYDVEVGWLGSTSIDDEPELAAAVTDSVEDGGVALVIVNTVRRAQALYDLVRHRGLPTEILHGRLTTSARGSRTASLVQRLGRSGPRPEQLVVVATQIAEQSFDVDADVLFTDLAPLDLMLQRVGRLHRHPRSRRPGHHLRPRTVVTGTWWGEHRPPLLNRGSVAVYDEYSLLRSAEIIGQSGSRWAIPDDIASLVATAYESDRPWPPEWEERGHAAYLAACAEREDRAARARAGVLRPTQGLLDRGTLDLLHASTGSEPRAERVAVRDGEPSVEVALVRVDSADGQYRTLGGRRLGLTGERAADLGIAREVLGDTVRLRHTEAGLDSWLPLPGWLGLPLLRDLPVIVLRDGDSTGPQGWGEASYDAELGLVIARRATR